MPKIQVLSKVTLPVGTEMMVACHVSGEPAKTLGMVEGEYQSMKIAKSVHRIGGYGRLWARCLYLGFSPLHINSGKIIDLSLAWTRKSYWGEIKNHPTNLHITSIPDRNLRSDTIRQWGCHGVSFPMVGKVQWWVTGIYQGLADQNYTNHEKSLVAKLLCDYQDVFSQGEHDIGHTFLVEHEIPTIPGSQPIRHPPRPLGPEKEAEVERQVADRPQRGLIEPADGGWSSPVVLVRKKDLSWQHY